jgi:integrase
VLKARAFGLGYESRERTLDVAEVKALLDALDLTAILDGTAKSQRLSEIVRLGIAFQLYVPLRTQSIIGARWSEFDLDAARWTVTSTPPPRRPRRLSLATEAAPQPQPLEP